MPLEETTSEETKKWEQPNYVFQQYPRMLYRGVAGPQGQPAYETCIVPGEDDEKKYARDGWKVHPLEAIEHYKGLQADMGTAAAERAYTDRKMSPKAQAEAKAAEEAHDGHMGEVPETSVKAKGKKPDAEKAF